MYGRIAEKEMSLQSGLMRLGFYWLDLETASNSTSMKNDLTLQHDRSYMFVLKNGCCYDLPFYSVVT